MTEIFFSRDMEKCGHQKELKEFFPLKENTNRWKTQVTNFYFKNQNKESRFGAAMAVFFG